MSESIKLKVLLNSLIFTNKAKLDHIHRLESTIFDLSQPLECIKEPGLRRIQEINKEMGKVRGNTEEAKTESIVLKGVVARMHKSCVFHKKRMLEIEDHYRRVSKFSREFQQNSLCSQQSANIARSHLNNKKLAFRRSRKEFKEKHAKLTSYHSSLSVGIHKLLSKSAKDRSRLNSLNAINSQNKASVDQKISSFKEILLEQDHVLSTLSDLKREFAKLKRVMKKDDLREIVEEFNKKQSDEISLMKEYEELLALYSKKQQEFDEHLDSLNKFKESGVVNSDILAKFPTLNMMRDSLERNKSIDIVLSYEKTGMVNLFQFSVNMWKYINAVANIDSFALPVEPNTKFVSSQIREFVLSLHKEGNKEEIDKNMIENSFTSSFSLSNASIKSSFLTKFPNKYKECSLFCSLLQNHLLVKSFITTEKIKEYLELESPKSASENIGNVYKSSNEILKKQFQHIASLSIQFFKLINIGGIAEIVTPREYITPAMIKSPRKSAYFVSKPTQGSSTSRVATPKTLKRPKSMSNQRAFVSSKNFRLKEILDLDQKLKKLKFRSRTAQKTNAFLKNDSKFKAFVPAFTLRFK